MSEELSAPINEKAIGLMVSKLREKHGLTTTELAKRVGISQAQISRLENGKQGFRSSTLRRIAEALGCDGKVAFVPKAPAALAGGEPGDQSRGSTSSISSASTPNTHS